MRERLRRAEDLLAAAEGAVLVALLGVMVTLAFAQVVLRHFGVGLLWGETLLKQLVMWTGFLGAALAARSEKHFAWEAAHLGTPESLRAPLRLVASLAGAAVCLTLFFAAWAFTADERTSGDILFTLGAFSVPQWCATVAIPGGFLLVGLHMIFKGADALFEILR